LSIPFVLIVVMAAVFGPVCSWLALRRARSWAVWFIFGVLLGPIAVGLLLAAPPGRCPSCAAPVRGWPRACASCGFAFGEPPTLPSERDGTPGLTLAVATPESMSPPAPTARSGKRGPTKSAAAAVAVDPVTSEIDDSPETRPATRLGRRATAIPRAAADGAASQTLAIMGSGVFVGGSDDLQIGSRYFLARVGGEFQALGPIHMSPSAVAMKMKINDTETTVVADRVLITGRGRASGRTLAFAGVSMEPGMNIEQELTGRRHQKVAAQ
jgi:hypothetical protein